MHCPGRWVEGMRVGGRVNGRVGCGVRAAFTMPWQKHLSRK